MGVMRCSRDNCESILCDTHVPDVGYVCRECQSEFEELNPNKILKSKLLNKLKIFINTSKSNFKGGDREISTNELFNGYD